MNLVTVKSDTVRADQTIDVLTANGFRFGDWKVLIAENRISQGDCLVRLEPKVMQLLLALISRHGQPCTREWLLNELWPSAETGESSLTRAISELRKALGDQRKPARYIDTIQRIGYKAIAPIRALKQHASLDRNTNHNLHSLSQQEETVAMARYLLVRRNEVDIRQAIHLLENFVSQRPYHAQLWAMLAYAKTILQSYSQEPAALHIRKARKHAMHALELDGVNGLAWAVLGTLAHHEWNWQEALNQYERAFSYEPNDPIILHGYAKLLQNIGDLDRAHDLTQRACQIEPLAASTHLTIGWIMLDADQEQSLQALIKARQLGADTVFTDNLECLLHHRNEWDEQSLQRWAQLNRQRRHDSCWLWPNYLLDALMGDSTITSLATNIRERVQLGQLNAGLAPFMLSMVNAIDAAYEMTRIAIESRTFFTIDPWLTEMEAYRSNSRFRQVLHLLGLTEHLTTRSRRISASE